MIPYLVGNEAASATYMNALFSEFDAKLSKLLAGGKSFFLAQDAAMPQKFCGKAFFFTKGPLIYSNRVPGWIDGGSGTTQAYDHTIFSNAVAAIDPKTVTWDDANRIAHVPAWPVATYGKLPSNIDGETLKPIGYGLLDWSLEAHTIQHQGPADKTPVAYYIQEASLGTGRVGASVMPEKHLRFCVAEIIIEGRNNVVFPVNYDKYKCFRVHNFNPYEVSLVFTHADGTVLYALTVPPYGCLTLRRDQPDVPDANYRRGYNYFFKFEGGDPRFYWFAPKAFSLVGQLGITMADSPVISNSMQANNLTNPAILLDWVNFFLRDLGPASLGADGNQTALDLKGFYAGWQQDPSVQADVKKFYKNIFGDPSDPTTLLGDLLHHRGDIMIIRSSKTATDPVTGSPTITFDRVTFNGYASIISDFAKKQLTVAEDANGNLTIANADAENNVYLIPYGTNLLKSAESHPTCVSLVGKNFTIESAVFENPDPANLSNTAPQLIFHPVATNATTSKTWSTWDAATLSYDQSSTLIGNPQTALNWATSRASAKTLNGIHKVKVSDLLTLDFWGDPKYPGQKSTYVSVTNAALTMTPEGLVLTFTETDSPAYAPTDPNWLNLKRGVPTVKSISFRGHGWGYFSAANGSRDTGWLTGRTGRYQFDGAYQYETFGPSGTDFQVNGGPTQTTVSVLGRLKLSTIGSDGRFWGTTPNDSLLKFMAQTTALDARTFGALFANSNEFAINAGNAPIVTGGTVAPVAMVLLPEMYNGLARAVNAINRASPLSWKCLRWNVFGISAGLSTATPFGGWFMGSWDPNTNTVSGETTALLGWRPTSLQMGIGIPGTTFLVVSSGPNNTNLDGVSDWKTGDVAMFTEAGIWVKKPQAWVNYGGFWGGGYFEGVPIPAGIFPMSALAVFDPGSQLETLCRQIGIPVRTAADLPGSVTGQSIIDLQNQSLCNGIIFDQVTVTASNINVDTSGPVTTSADITGTIYSELLSANSLLNGQATGSRCLGSWDDSLLASDAPFGAIAVSASYSQIGMYWVVPADNKTSRLGQIKKGDLVFINSFIGDPSIQIWGVVTVASMAAKLNVQKGITIEGFDLNNFVNEPQLPDGTAAGGVRWIMIRDVQNAVEALGFQFSFMDKCLPISLHLLNEPSSAGVLFSGGGSRTVTASGTVNQPLNSGSPYYIPPAVSTLLTPDNRLGISIKACPAADAGALWKISGTLGSAIGLPIAQIVPAQGHSPIMHAMSGTMVYDPHLAVGANMILNGATGGGQFYGRASDTISTEVNADSSYDVGYIITGFSGSDAFNLVPLGLVEGAIEVQSQEEGSNFNRLFVQAFQVQTSAGFQAFPSELVLVGIETWSRPADWWAQSLFNANIYADSIFGVTSFNHPWQYYGAPAPVTTTLGTASAVNIVAAPGTNASYTLLSNIGAPLVAM